MHHLHMVEVGSGFWERHLLFRDFLRAHPDVADKYYRLKVRLAVELDLDRGAYTDAKTSFIESVVARARAEEATASCRKERDDERTDTGGSKAANR